MPVKAIALRTAASIVSVLPARLPLGMRTTPPRTVAIWPSPMSYSPSGRPVARMESVIRIVRAVPLARIRSLTIAGWTWMPSQITWP